MRFKLLKTIVFILLLVFYGSFLVRQINLPMADDMGRHVINGQQILRGNFDVLFKNVYSYTTPDYPFVNHHWLSGVLFYALYVAVGWDGLMVFKIAVLFAAFTLTFLTSLKRANFWLVSALAPVAILIMSQRPDLRPEMFSYLFISLFLYLFAGLEDDPKSKKIYWLIPVQVLWVNMHIFSPAGPLVAAGFFCEKLFANRAGSRNNGLLKKAGILFLALVAACGINPNGLTGAFYVLYIFQNYGMNITENLSLLAYQQINIPWGNPPMAAFVPAVFVLALSFLFNLHRRPVFYFLAGIVTIIGGFAMMRLLPMFGMMFLPIVSANLNGVSAGVGRFFRTLFPRDKRAGGIAIAGLILALCALAFWGLTRPSDARRGLGLEPRSGDAAEFFRQNNLRGPIFNDYDMGPYLTYNFYPQEKVFMDNRPEAYPVTFFADTYLPALADESVWRKILDEYGFNVIFFYRYDKGDNVLTFLYRRAKDADWALVHADQFSAIFVRNNAQNREIIDKYRITSENVGERLRYLRDSDVYAEQVAAADNFNLVGRTDLAKETFLNIVGRWPERGRIWMVLAETELLANRNDPKSVERAIQYLTTALDAGHRTAEAYSFLGFAYYRAGDYDKAREFLDKALRINPERLDAKDLRKSIENN